MPHVLHSSLALIPGETGSQSRVPAAHPARLFATEERQAGGQNGNRGWLGPNAPWPEYGTIGTTGKSGRSG